MIPRLVFEVAPVPAAGAAALYAIGLFALLGTLVAIGMQKAWAETLGNFLRHLAGWINVGIHVPGFGTRHPFDRVAKLIRAADTQVFNAFGYLILKGETASAWCFSTGGNIFAWMAAEIAGLARDVLSYAQRTAVGTIPAEIGKLRRTILDRLHGIDRTLGRLEAQAKAQLKRLQVGIDRLSARLEHTLTQAIHAVTARVGALERRTLALPKRLTRVEQRLAIGAFTATVAVALSRLGLRWIRCGNVRRVGQAVCKMDTGLLLAFLSQTFEALLVLDLCRFALAAQKLARFIVPQLGSVLLVQNAVCLGGGATLPSAHDSPKVTTKITNPSALLSSER